MKKTHYKKYSLDESKTRTGFIVISTHQRREALIYARDYGTMVNSSFAGFEEYLFEDDSIFRADNKGGDDLEVHSLTEKGLKKLIGKLKLQQIIFE